MEKYRVIDADAHFWEPESFWTGYLEHRYLPMAPQWVKDSQGRPRMLVGGKLRRFAPGPPDSFEKMGRGARDAKSRLADMDREGIEVMVNYPSNGIWIFGVDDIAVMVALCRALNNWVHDYCSANPRRLLSPAVLPQLDVIESMAELKRAATELGVKAALLRPNPVGDRNLDDPAFEPLWSLMEELDVALVLHEGTTQDVPEIGPDRFDNYLYAHMCSHSFEQQMALMCLICGGVLERHPNLRVMQVEAGCGWVPYWLDRMNHHMHSWGHASIKLREKPSDYFKRQCFISADGEERMIPEVIKLMGDDNICFSTDYPHPDHPFEGVVAELADRKDIPEQSKKKILGENAARAFKI
jgi:uncharacterized protein